MHAMVRRRQIGRGHDKCKLCKCAACAVCTAAANAFAGPFVTVSVTDLDNATEWLGHWQRFNLSSSEWRRFEAAVPLPRAKRGHILDVAVVLGHAAATYLIDDVTIIQRDPPATGTSLAVDFEDQENSPPAAIGVAAVAQTAAESGGAAVVASAGSSQSTLLTANLASAAAAHGGSYGAEVTTREAVTPAWHARLELGTISAALNAVRVTFWARALRKCVVNANLLDASAGYKWLAFWQPFNLTTKWQQFTAMVELPSSLAGGSVAEAATAAQGGDSSAAATPAHLLQALVLGGSATTYFIDDVSLVQSCENWPTPAAPPTVGETRERLEDCSTGGAVPTFELGGKAGEPVGEGKEEEGSGSTPSKALSVDAQLYSEVAARSGRFGARITVHRPPPVTVPRPKLRLGTLRLAPAERASDAVVLSLWVRLHPPERGGDYDDALSGDAGQAGGAGQAVWCWRPRAVGRRGEDGGYGGEVLREF